MSLKPVHTENAPAAVGPYSQAMIVGDLVFCSGQIPLDPATGELLTGSVADQTRLVLKNLSAVLEAAGSSLDRVVKCNVFMRDLGEFATMNAVYEEVFGGHKPARAAVEVSRLPKDADVEIEAVALI